MSKNGIVVLMYHSVYKTDQERNSLPREDRPYAVSVETFREHLEIIQAEKFSTITLSSLCDQLSGIKQLQENSVVITFDDGYKDFYDNALPLLLDFKCKASIFVTVGWIGDSRMLTWEQLTDLVKYDVEIGSHSLHHPFLTSLSDPEIINELVESKKQLDEQLKIVVDHFSLPGGRLDPRLKSHVKSAGYASICTSVPGTNRTDDEQWNIKRIPVKGTTSDAQFRKYLLADETTIQSLQRSYIIKNKIKRVLGNSLYHTIYKLFSR